MYGGLQDSVSSCLGIIFFSTRDAEWLTWNLSLSLALNVPLVFLIVPSTSP